jgi:predicted GH43/DUF377 family glycosyl hydrolase
MVHIKHEGILLEKTHHEFESEGVLNPGCMQVGNEVHIYYRAFKKGNISTIGYCRLDGPLDIVERLDRPLLVQEHPFESQGLEDPRVVNIDGVYHMTYTGYDGVNALGALATSTDLTSFTKHGVITPRMTYKEFKHLIECCTGLSEKYLFHYHIFMEHGLLKNGDEILLWDKDLALFPRKLNGKFALLHRIFPDIQVVYYNSIEELTAEFWQEYVKNIMDYIVLAPQFHYETSHLGAGCPPIETDDGWLLINHAVEMAPQGKIYHASASLHDIDDPTIELARLPEPLFSPQFLWEKNGYIYYGAADSRVAVVSLAIDELLSALNSHRRTPHKVG